LIQDELDKCVAELEQQIDKDLRRLTYERLSRPETVLDLQGYQNRLRATQQRLTEEVENIFARLRNRASDYVKLKFATDGAVAEELAFPSLGAIQLKIDLVNLGVVLPHLDKKSEPSLGLPRIDSAARWALLPPGRPVRGLGPSAEEGRGGEGPGAFGCDS
jgi:hypothetical protein